MSEAAEVDAGTAAAPAGMSGLAIAAGFCVAGMLLSLAGILFHQFLTNRPDNIVEHTGKLSQVFEEALRANYVPAENIPQRSAAVRSDDRARWLFTTMEVLLPNRLNADGLHELMSASMREHGVKVEVTDVSPGGQRWVLKLGRLDIGVVRVREEKAIQAVTDLRAASNRITNGVEDALIAAGVPEAALRRGTPEVQRDEETIWTLTSMEATLPDSLTPGDLKAVIEDALSARDVRVEAEEAVLGRINLRVYYAAKPCVDVICRTHDASLTPPAEPTAAEDTPPPEEAPQPAAPEDVPAEPAPAAPETGASAADVRVEPPDEAVDLELAKNADATGTPGEDAPPAPPKPREVRARIAVILDDGGNDWPVAEQVLALSPKLTLSLLPNTPHVANVAEAAGALGFEVMLHMPMETDSKTVDPGPGKITTAMAKAAVQKRVRDALAQVAGVKGMNNHTGSRFMADDERLGWVLEIVKEQGLFFVDSRTAANSVGYATAQAAGVPTAERDVFLDDKYDTHAGLNRWEELVSLAKKRGSAIGIGHFRPGTAELLAEEIPKLKEQGVELVHVSELLQ